MNKDMIEENEALKLAHLFHSIYESLAPSFGYETKDDTRVFNSNSKNGKLMVATCYEILKRYNNRLGYNGLVQQIRMKSFDISDNYKSEKWVINIDDVIELLDKYKSQSDYKEENKALRQLLEWMIECDFGLDNIWNEEDVNMTEEEFNKRTENMDYTDILIYYAKLYLQKYNIKDNTK